MCVSFDGLRSEKQKARHTSKEVEYGSAKKQKQSCNRDKYFW
jgi:hypothetical protein